MFSYKIKKIKQHRSSLSFYKDDDVPMISFLNGDFKQSKFYLFFMNQDIPYVIYDEENDIFGFLEDIKNDYFYYNLYQSTKDMSTMLFEISDYLYYINGLTKKSLKKRLIECLKELKEVYQIFETDNKKVLIGESFSYFYSGKINIIQEQETHTLSFEIGTEIFNSRREELFDISKAFFKYAQERLSSLNISEGKEDSYWYLRIN
jgi:hypothetical protein